MSLQSEFVPQVPFASYEEYEEMLQCLVDEYEIMVLKAASSQRVVAWCTFHMGFDHECHVDLLHGGHDLFLKFTKGLGADWCDAMNTMVVHSIGTAVRATIEARKYMGFPMDGSVEDRLYICDLLLVEIRSAIENPCQTPNNMPLFEERNFKRIWKHDDDFDCDVLPIAQLQALQLAFCMLSHGRLGCGGAGRDLSGDVIKLILMKMLE